VSDHSLHTDTEPDSDPVRISVPLINFGITQVGMSPRV